MRLAEPPFDAAVDNGWHAELALEYARRGPRSVLATRRHNGPLVVQKPLYPEGDAVCHNILVHPPAGIAGGDHLEIHARVGENAHALLTTPGAGKWYRSAGPWAQQHIRFELQAGAILEWLPQETIVYDGALAKLTNMIELAAGAHYIGWEILCLGRTGSGERFTRGACHLSTRLSRAGRPLWLERGQLAAGGPLSQSKAGLGSKPVCATLLATLNATSPDLLAACRSVVVDDSNTSVTQLPGLLVARFLGASSEAAKHYFTALWSHWRAAVIGRAAVQPRIWRT